MGCELTGFVGGLVLIQQLREDLWEMLHQVALPYNSEHALIGCKRDYFQG